MKYFDNKSFLPKTIQADSPLYRSRIKSLPKNKETQERLKLYNLLKSDPNAVFTFYHGTSESIWEAIQQKGYFKSPKIRNMEQRESRNRGLEEVFFTTSVRYADTYAIRAEGQTGSKGLILELRIPIYYLKEVSDVILGTEYIDRIYNEFRIPHRINEIIENKEIDIKQKAEAIKAFFVNQISAKTSDEFTIKHAVPIRFVVGNSKNSINLWKRWVEENPEKYEEAIELFPNDKKEFYETYKQGYLQLVKKDPTIYEKVIQLFPNHKEEFYEAFKQGYVQRVKNDPEIFYEKAIKLFPNDKDIYQAGKQGYLQLVEHYPKYYEKAIQLFSNDIEEFANAGRQYFLNFFASKTFVERQELFDYVLMSRKLYPDDREIYKASKKSVMKLLEPPHYNFADPAILHAFLFDDDIFEKFMKLLESNLTITHDSNKTKAEYIKAFSRDLHLIPISRQSDFFTRLNEILDKLSDQKPKQACGWYNRIKIANKENWQMTEDEFLKHHYTGFIPSDAYKRYETSTGISFIKKSNYPNLYDMQNIDGKKIEYRIQSRDLQFVKKDKEGNIIYDDNGMAVILTKQEMLEHGYPIESHEIAAFVDDQPIGFASNEFGSTGVWVIKDMQNKGIGTKLLYDFRKLNPHMQSSKLGQMTNAGYNLARKYHQKLVQDALQEQKRVPQNVLESTKKHEHSTKN